MLLLGRSAAATMSVVVVAIVLATTTIRGVSSTFVAPADLHRGQTSSSTSSSFEVQDNMNRNIQAPSSSADTGFRRQSRRTSSTRLSAGVFDDIRKFFDDMSGGNSNENRDSDDEDDDDDDDDVAAGTVRVASIPVTSIKPGGLRLFLMLYLLGMQNTPERNSWRADQPARDEYVIDYWYHDRSAVLTVTLGNESITIDRTGTNPSTSYMMHETMIVQGVLDELDQCAFDQSVEEENRLLVLPEPKDAIDKARGALSFG